MGKVKGGKSRKKVKRTAKTSAQILVALCKKSSRAGKQGGGSKSGDGESSVYGVVPSEYNIQAQINWLTAPPATSGEKKTSNNVPPPSKKPQRGYHKDVCEACGECDYLMYCDKCPSAYHAICDDPPLPPEDYETIGLNWKCKKCRCLLELEGGSHKSIASSCSKPGDGPISKFFQEFLPAQQIQNPSQFTLSKEVPAYHYPFPGTSRQILKKGRHRTGVIDVENGMVPRPTVLCYHCNRSCRIGALIQCDKCDLFFHLDCLDPPLTTIPATVWMCPLHVEPYLESTQLTSVALSERVKIWDSTERPVNRSAVIVNFLKKTARKNPMFRRKKLIPMTLSPEVPEMVQNCYKEDVMYVHERFGKLQTLAAACEVERLKVEMEENVSKYRNKWIDHYLPLGKSLVQHRSRLEYLRSKNESKIEHIRNVLKTYEELEDQRTVKFCAENDTEFSSTNMSRLSHLLDEFPNGNMPDNLPVVPSTSASCREDSVAVAIPSTSAAAAKALKDALEEEKKYDMLPEASSFLNVEIRDENGDPIKPESSSVDNHHDDDNEDNEEFEKMAKWVYEEIKAADADADEDLKAVNELSRDVRRVGELLLNFPLTDEYCNNLASKTVIEEQPDSSVVAPIVDITTQPVLPATNLLESAPTVPPPLYKPREPIGLQLEAVRNLPKKTVTKLAACHLRNIRRKKEIKDFLQSEKFVHNISPTASLPGPRPIISFYIENLCMNVEITKRSFWIGSGDSSDWKITDFVKCNRIDEKHAKMFYNPHENCWEILNYSPHGLYVNNTLFGFKSQEAHVQPSYSTFERLQEIHEMSTKRLDEYIRTHSDELHDIDMTPCFCKPFPTKAMTNVFEGSAKLYPGHRLQIGCAKLTIEGFLSSLD